MRSAIGVPVVLPSYTPERISTRSSSRRWVTWREVPGFLGSRSGWMSASESAIPGGQPSITHPIAGPWDSPNVVTVKRVPRVEPDMVMRVYCIGTFASRSAGCEGQRNLRGLTWRASRWQGGGRRKAHGKSRCFDRHCSGILFYSYLGIVSSEPKLKPLFWIGGSKADLKALPAPVTRAFGFALYLAQLGGKHVQAKRYTVRFKEAVF